MLGKCLRRTWTRRERVNYGRAYHHLPRPKEFQSEDEQAQGPYHEGLGGGDRDVSWQQMSAGLWGCETEEKERYNILQKELARCHNTTTTTREADLSLSSGMENQTDLGGTNRLLIQPSQMSQQNHKHIAECKGSELGTIVRVPGLPFNHTDC